MVTQSLPGDRDGLYGGTMNNAECDRDKMIDFLSSHPAQAGAFVEALNTDPALYWSGGHPLTAADIPTYLRELTPTVLRLDTRVTNHGFDGTHPTTLQSVFQPGTAVFVDAHGLPRARCYCGNPLTAPVRADRRTQTGRRTLGRLQPRRPGRGPTQQSGHHHLRPRRRRHRATLQPARRHHRAPTTPHTADPSRHPGPHPPCPPPDKGANWILTATTWCILSP